MTLVMVGFFYNFGIWIDKFIFWINHDTSIPVIGVLRASPIYDIPIFMSYICIVPGMAIFLMRMETEFVDYYHRYYDAVTVGIDFTARDLQRKFREAGNPWELCKGFDNSAAIGTFVPLEQVGGNVQNLDFHLTIDDKEVQRGHTSDMLFRVDDIIAYVSRFMTLKIGDLLFTGTPVGVGPVSIGQHLQGYLGEEKVLDFNIR